MKEIIDIGELSASVLLGLLLLQEWSRVPNVIKGRVMIVQLAAFASMNKNT